MLLHFKKSNQILKTWSPHCKNLKVFLCIFEKELSYDYLMFKGNGKILLERQGKSSALLAVSVPQRIFSSNLPQLENAKKKSGIKKSGLDAAMPLFLLDDLLKIFSSNCAYLQYQAYVLEGQG